MNSNSVIDMNSNIVLIIMNVVTGTYINNNTGIDLNINADQFWYEY